MRIYNYILIYNFGIIIQLAWKNLQDILLTNKMQIFIAYYPLYGREDTL